MDLVVDTKAELVDYIVVEDSPSLSQPCDPESPRQVAIAKINALRSL